MPHAPASGIANLRDMFSRTEKDRVPADLKHALILLGLSSLTELEERFLATTAFLVPWAMFRDSCLLVNSPRKDEPTIISRLEVLWFYTQFDEGLRRHDPRIEKPGAHFEIDKSEWSHTEHEKHLYAWLLQTFCVGKVYSPFGFRYFELRNVCTVWVEVFVPIINAVRASYSVKGRRHYGRLALYIEDRCPSRLAFPEGNVSMPFDVMNSPTPFRVVSRPTHLRGASQTVLTTRNYDEAEKELRSVYPQYGGLVERPRFKQKMDEWLQVQRERAAHRKTIAKPETVQYVPKYQPEVIHGSQQSSGGKSPTRSPSNKKGNSSPIKQYAESIRRSFSMSTNNNRMGKTEPQSPLSPVRPKTPIALKVPVIPYGKYSYVPKISEEEPKSPLHGVTRQIDIPNDGDDDEDDDANIDTAWPLPVTYLPRPQLPEQRLSEQSVYTSIRHSNPYSQDTPNYVVGRIQGSSTDVEDNVWSPMGAPSAIPRPLKKNDDNFDATSPQPLLRAKKSVSEVRHPSYEGNGYANEISLKNLHARNISAGSRSFSSDEISPKPRSRLPAPIQVPPSFVSELRVTPAETYRDNVLPKPSSARRPSKDHNPVPWSKSLPYGVATVSESVPPIPAKNPERWASRRDLRLEQLVGEHTPEHQGPIHPALREDGTEREMLRIVSKENIRSALGSMTPESSTEDLRARTKAPTRVVSPPRLETYNSHMFPRKYAREGGS